MRRKKNPMTHTLLELREQQPPLSPPGNNNRGGATGGGLCGRTGCTWSSSRRVSCLNRGKKAKGTVTMTTTTMMMIEAGCSGAT
mmetsp:Transcript_28923/g.39377  ORF Transcript_28923/g.39377 Transcript_28923/m.39377 type:complete len:84 (+) Transcript_28923:408-659(+)